MTNAQIRSGPSRNRPAAKPVAPVAVAAPIELEPEAEYVEAYVPTKTPLELTNEMLDRSGIYESGTHDPALSCAMRDVRDAAENARPFASAYEENGYEAQMAMFESRIVRTRMAEQQQSQSNLQQQIDELKNRQPTERVVYQQVPVDDGSSKFTAHAQAAAMKNQNMCPCSFCSNYRARTGIGMIPIGPLHR